MGVAIAARAVRLISKELHLDLVTLQFYMYIQPFRTVLFGGDTICAVCRLMGRNAQKEG